MNQEIFAACIIAGATVAAAELAKEKETVLSSKYVIEEASRLYNFAIDEFHTRVKEELENFG